MTSRIGECAAGEEPTPKELEVLRLLATRLSRSEIGARLNVSLNTAKTHPRAVYHKLVTDGLAVRTSQSIIRADRYELTRARGYGAI